MHISLIIFFAALLGIMVMIGRKVWQLRTVPPHRIERFTFEVPDAEQLKSAGVRHLRRGSYALLVIILRAYVRSSNAIRENGRRLAQKVKAKLARKNKNGDAPAEEHEVSKFLKMMSEYKRKLGHITKRIKEEENGKR
ncbi:MAG TPA: hypothetical protein VG694_01195 [Candidatus Paceibacterota bacterium]|jgi:hypothetical protein|nr:hypothetical protein [Candidatus Paceibacterota bacterium]